MSKKTLKKKATNKPKQMDFGFTRQMILDEFIKDGGIKYPKPVDVWRNYFYGLTIDLIKKNKKPDLLKAYEKNYIKDSPTWFKKITKGIKNEREQKLQEIQSKKADELAKQEAQLELKNKFLSAEPYIEKYNKYKEIDTIILQRSLEVFESKLSRYKTDMDDWIKSKRKGSEPEPPIFVFLGDRGSFARLTAFWRMARVALKLPINYNVNMEEKETKNSLLDLVNELSKKGVDLERLSEQYED